MTDDTLQEILKHVTAYEFEHPGKPRYGEHGWRIDEGDKTVRLVLHFPHPESSELYSKFTVALGEAMRHRGCGGSGVER